MPRQRLNMIILIVFAILFIGILILSAGPPRSVATRAPTAVPTMTDEPPMAVFATQLAAQAGTPTP